MKTKNLPVLFYEDSRPDTKGLSRIAIIEHPRGGRIICLKGCRDYFTGYMKDYHLTVIGPKIFWKGTQTASVTYKDGKLYGNVGMFSRCIGKALHLDWIESWIFNYILCGRKDMWKLVLDGKVTNPEDLCKAFSRKYFKGEFSYRTIKAYYSSPCNALSLWDLYYYTTNPDVSAHKIADNQMPSVFFDMIRYCRMLNTRINPAWSERRMNEEHQKQIEIKNAEEANEYPDTPIADPFKIGSLELILDERSLFLEGIKMHNCVHSYWNYIRKGDYLIARGTANGQYINLGIDRKDSKIRLEQVHTKYNRGVDMSTELYCLTWINTNKESLDTMMRYLASKHKEYAPTWRF